MELDIVIAGSMALGSVVALLGIILSVARAVREAPDAGKRSPTAPALRPTSGW
jgi:hypothetical protein